MSRPFFAQYRKREREIEHEFGNLPFFTQLPLLTDLQFKRYLLQRFHTSKEFIGWYNKALICPLSVKAKAALRRILYDEVSGDKKTHLELLVDELTSIGIPLTEILASQQTARTTEILRRMEQLVSWDHQDQYEALKILTGLRVAGEVLVSIEYEQIISELERRDLLKRVDSVFYVPHQEHDSSSTGSHSDAFAQVLSEYLVEGAAVQVAVLSLEGAYSIRRDFLDQTFTF